MVLMLIMFQRQILDRALLEQSRGVYHLLVDLTAPVTHFIVILDRYNALTRDLVYACSRGRRVV